MTGLDGLFIEGSESEGREYLQSLPYYYRVDLPPQSLLVFNNAYMHPAVSHSAHPIYHAARA